MFRKSANSWRLNVLRWPIESMRNLHRSTFSVSTRACWSRTNRASTRNRKLSS